jgi:hypothetical protein
MRRPNEMAKSEMLDHLRLKLQRRLHFNLIMYLDEGTLDLTAVVAQTRIKLEILRLENQ